MYRKISSTPDDEKLKLFYFDGLGDKGWQLDKAGRTHYRCKGDDRRAVPLTGWQVPKSRYGKTFSSLFPLHNSDSSWSI